MGFKHGFSRLGQIEVRRTTQPYEGDGYDKGLSTISKHALKIFGNIEIRPRDFSVSNASDTSLQCSLHNAAACVVPPSVGPTQRKIFAMRYLLSELEVFLSRLSLSYKFS